MDRHQDGASEAAMLDSGGVLTPDFFYGGRSSRVLHTHAVSKSEARVRERKVVLPQPLSPADPPLYVCDYCKVQRKGPRKEGQRSPRKS